jgi:hypothetical protein
VTTYLVDVHHDTHVCPADPQPHAFYTRQQVVAVTASGPCRTPVTIRIGDTTATIPCGSHEPSERQCGACRTITWVRNVTETFHGYQGPAHLDPRLVGAAA